MMRMLRMMKIRMKAETAQRKRKEVKTPEKPRAVNVEA